MGQNPSGPCLKEKVHGGTNLLDEKLFLHMKHVTVSETHIKRLYAYCCSFLGKNSLAFCSCPTLTTLDKTENLTAPFCCYVGSILARTQSHRSPANYQPSPEHFQSTVISRMNNVMFHFCRLNFSLLLHRTGQLWSC